MFPSVVGTPYQKILDVHLALLRNEDFLIVGQRVKLCERLDGLQRKGRIEDLLFRIYHTLDKALLD